MKKKCSKCGIEKEATKENFHVEKLSPDGLRKDCRECRNIKRRERREWETNKNPEYDRIKDLRRYGVTVEWYDKKLTEQGGHCALCDFTPEEHFRRLNVDHDHACCKAKRGTRGRTCGECTRGILCNACNQKLGYLEQTLRDLANPSTGEVDLRNSLDKSSWTARALQYLKRYTK